MTKLKKIKNYKNKLKILENTHDMYLVLMLTQAR